MTTPTERLALADPDLARIFRRGLAGAGGVVSGEARGRMVEQILWALSLEISFGETLTRSYAALLPRCGDEILDRYGKMVSEAGRVGPTLGRTMAGHAVAVYGTGDAGLVEAFGRATDVMRGKGTYTLNRPLAALDRILESGDATAAGVFLALLADAFSQEMSYNQCLHLTQLIPRAVTKMAPEARAGQIRQLHRVLARDLALVEPFLDGLERGLELLTEAGLARFVDAGLVRYGKSPERGRVFFALSSREAAAVFRSLQVTVSLGEAAPRINRYLRARTGRRLAVQPLSALPAALAPRGAGEAAACNDGRFIYLPETLGVFAQREGNLALYQDLARLESAQVEFDTYDFDLERIAHRCRLPGPVAASEENLPDMTAFFRRFDSPGLAEALLTIAEHGRLHQCLSGVYAGLAKRLARRLGEEARRVQSAVGRAPLDGCYRRVVLGKADGGDALQGAAEALAAGVARARSVEDCALRVVELYDRFAGQVDADEPLLTPLFGRRLRPDLFLRAHQKVHRNARALQRMLREKGIRVYRTDLHRHLSQSGEDITPEAVYEMAEAVPSPPGGRLRTDRYLSRAELQAMMAAGADRTVLEADEAVGEVFWYPEWADAQGDYLDRHCRVLEKPQAMDGKDALFAETLSRHQGLVRRLRYAFELLRPEGLVLLRQWIEGDDFDYRALLDFAMDRRAGLMPSDRLYIKRLKRQRDVAVLLLVDLSRSTANTANGTGSQSVLDVEKEAMVLFCEALGVVGDRFAIAGFSGTGRLGVDYFRIKDFDEPMGPAVRRRVSAMAPQRSTRMGAAIRHAVARFEAVPAAVRLLIVLGDGFPNDADYKGDHAVADTRRAVNEARSKNIFTHGITVNMAADPLLDNLYGRVRHNVISDIRELPDRLLRIYGALTR